MKTILVVDDFAAMRRVICAILERNGYMTAQSDSISTSLALLNDPEISIDLVLTDFLLRNENGHQLLGMIRQHSVVPDIPLIFMSTEKYPARLLEQGGLQFAGWIRKPVNPDLLLSKIEKTLF